LMLETMRHAEELVRIESIRPPKSREPDAREIKLAEQLIATLEDKFDPAAYRDEHREQVLALLERKAEGKVVQFPKAAKRPPQRSLEEALEASLAAGKKRAGGGRGRCAADRRTRGAGVLARDDHVRLGQRARRSLSGRALRARAAAAP